MKLLFPLAVVLCVLVATNVVRVSGDPGSSGTEKAQGGTGDSGMGNGKQDTADENKSSSSSSESDRSKHKNKPQNAGAKPGMATGLFGRAKSGIGAAATWVMHQAHLGNNKKPAGENKQHK